MVPLDAPLTPDGDTARSWVEDELARPEYGHELNPLTRGVRWVLAAILEALGTGRTDVPLAPVLIGAFALFLLVLLVVVVRNPVRLRVAPTSSAVFDGEDRSLEDVLGAARAAAGRGDWDGAVVWVFRALVLTLSVAGVVRDSPGLTAREASSQAAAHVGGDAGWGSPGWTQEFTWAGELFDSVRYGTRHATGGDHARLDLLLGEVSRARREVAPAGARPGVPR